MTAPQLPDGLPFYLGTMSFSHADWVGAVYPPSLPQQQYLAHYAKYFNAVEIDSTFYGTPRVETVKRWAQVTPPDFCICVKTPRAITHEMRLVNALGQMDAFVRTMHALEEKLGVILIQFGPDFTVSEFDILDDFLSRLPGNTRYAVEFRHKSWAKRKTSEMLLSHNASWVSTHYTIMPRMVHQTANFLYLRWIGVHKQFSVKNRIQKDMTDALVWWRDQLLDALDGKKAVYGFFNNDFAGFSPASCNQMKGLLGLPVRHPRVPKQATLF